VDSASGQEVSGLRDLLLGFQPLFDGHERKDMVSFASQNRDFHTYLVGLAHNNRLLSIYQSLNIDVLGSTVYRQADAIRPAGTVYAEHEAIVLAYEARDSAAAEAAISAHLTTARESHSKAFAAQDARDSLIGRRLRGAAQ
jgi:DNA-binding GntR family transcriptional regulator